MLQQMIQTPKPQVLSSNLMRRKFNYRETNIVTAPASDQSLAGAVLYMGEAKQYCMFWKNCGEIESICMRRVFPISSTHEPCIGW